MNSNEVAPKVNARLKRIKIISRFIKAFFLLYSVSLIFPIVFGPKVGQSYWTILGKAYFGSEYGSAIFLDAPIIVCLTIVLAAAVLLATIVTGFQLLKLYEKGVVFSSRNVQLFGRIGYLILIYGLLKLLATLLIMTMVVSTHWTQLSGHLENIFWGIVFIFLNSPWIVAGLVIIVVFHIMDEGRKIQEEQELTV
jgi:hypothetical protein